MNKLISPSTSLLALRIMVSIIMMAHGFQRMYFGTVNDFGGFLNAKGFVIGVLLAWAITVFELVAGALMMFNFFTRWIAVIWAAQLLMGIFLVHAQNGWFVVGPSMGGIEYSLLLIVCLLVLFANDLRKNTFK